MSPTRRSALLALATLFPAPVLAANVNYIGNNTFWSNPAAWSTNALPAPADNVFIQPSVPANLTNTLTLNSTTSINSLFLGPSTPGNITLALALGNLTANSLNIAPDAAITGNGTLAAPLNNAGSILATKLALTLTANSTNSGLLNALNGGTLSLFSSGSSLDNTSGTILSSGTGSTSFSNIAISGGSLSTDPTAQIHLQNNSSLADVSASGNLFFDGATSISNSLLAGNITQNPLNPATLSGTITNNANWSNASLNITSPAALTGNGTLFLSGVPTAIIGNSTLSIGPGQTLQGNTTIIGVTLANFGTLRALNSNLTLFFSSSSSSTFTNAGTLTAGPGGSLVIDNDILGTLDNSGGTISATGNGTVQLLDHSVSGGTLSTDATGRIILSTSTVTGASLSGNISVSDASALFNDSLSGNITLTGAAATFGGNIALIGNLILATNINFNTDLSFTGNGTTQASGTGHIVGSTNSSFSIGPGHTFAVTSGSCLLTLQTGSSFVNAGTARAEHGLFQIILTNSPAGFVAATNSGTLSATSNGLIFFGAGGPASPSLFDNTNGVISGAGGFVQFTDINLFGGQLSGAITFQGALSSAALSGSLSLTGNTTLRNDSLSGSVAAPSNVTLSLSGTLAGNANWNAKSLRILDAVTLAGSGTITFNGNITSPGPASLSIAPSQTFQGSGLFGQAITSLTLNNSGTILANVPSTSLFLVLPPSPLLPFTNSGLMSASNGATLELADAGPAAVLDNTNGTLSASGPASTLTIDTLTLSGGQITSTPEAHILLNGTTLSHVAISGNISTLLNVSLRSVTLGGTFAQGANSTVTLSGTFANNANWTNANISIPQTLIIAGVNSINLANTSISSSSANTAVLLTVPTITIAGSGAIGSGFSAFINNGLIWANVPASNLTISCPLTNTSAIAIIPTASMTISAPFNTTGTLDVNGSLTINAPTTGAVFETGDGNLSFNAAYTTTADSTFSAGLVSFFSNTNSIGRVFGNATLFVDAGSGNSPGLTADGIQAANLSLKGSVRIRANGSNSGTSKLGILQNAPSGPTGWLYTLDITNNKLIVEPSPATHDTALANIRSQVAWGASHAAGITSTALPAHTVLAVIDNSHSTFSSFGGLPVDANAILVAPEIPGDANIDGHVDLSDLAAVLNHFGKPSLNWLDGNFDNAPTIDNADLTAVLNNFGLTNPLALAANSQPALTATPEPATSLLTLLAPPLLLRRRRTSPRMPRVKHNLGV